MVAKKNLAFKNLLAEIFHFNTPKYKNQFSQEKSTGSDMWGYIRLHFHKHFDQKSGLLN